MKRNKFLKTLIGLPFVVSILSFNKRQPSYEKTIFTPEMLRRHNVGLFIINTKVKEITEKNVGYAATVSWKLCYKHTEMVNTIKAKVTETFKWNMYGMVNFLTDGWFCPIGDTDEQVCGYLNNNPYGETYRVMTKEEVLFIISHRKQGFL